MTGTDVQLGEYFSTTRERLRAVGLAQEWVETVDKRALCSEFVVHNLCQVDGLGKELSADGQPPGPFAADSLHDEFACIGAHNAEVDALRLLRELRTREMTRIAWRDLAGADRLDQTLASLSELADRCVAAAVDFAHARAVLRHGHARNDAGEPLNLLTLAMGKLGGGELNFSSDIDVVFLYLNGGETDGPRPLSHSQYFTRIAQTAIRLLDAQTEHGFVFRVDTRLRPFGTSGALVAKLESFDAYLQRHGRAWERYAYLKARLITGNAAERDAVAQLITPFVYRRYLDYGVFESLRDMQARIAAEVARRELADDVKRGPGGIREIEFIVQSLQLLRGGRFEALRSPPLLPALGRLAGENFLSADAGASLGAAYRFLRRLENRLQCFRDQQVHALPGDALTRAQLARTMDCADWQALAAQIAQHRSAVTHWFGEVVVLPSAGTGQPADDPLAELWQGSLDDQEGAIRLSAAGFERPSEVLQMLGSLRVGLLARLDESGRLRLNRLVPALLHAAAAHGGSIELVRRLLAIVDQVGRRSAYFALLNERPAVLDRLVDLCHRSAFVADQVARQPVLLDGLIDPRLAESPPSREALEADLLQRLQATDAGDLEAQMETLREFQRGAVLQIAVADLGGVLPLMRVSDRLSDVAELAIKQVTLLARQQLQTRYGSPAGRLQADDLAIIAYGKLGGLELGYGSDLDLVFVFDVDPDTPTRGGDRSIPASVYFTRLVQRIVHMLSTQTASGKLYEVDIRLRPSGRKGLLVSSLAAFAKYQRHEAWTWEHQALLRARAVAGDAELIRRFEAVRREVLTTPSDPARLKREISDMRERMRREGPQASPGRFDLKRGVGGVVDIEFLVQYWVLRSAGEHPQLLNHSDNMRQLDALAAVEILPQSEADTLQKIYLEYRARLHRQSLQRSDETVAANEFAAARQSVSQSWVSVFGGGATAVSV